MSTTAKRKSNYAVIVNKATAARSKVYQTNEWGIRHWQAWQQPSKGSEAMIKAQIVALAEYADQYHHAANFEPSETLADDGYAGAYWLEIAQAIIKLLSMDLGRLDGGTLDDTVRAIMQNEGFDAYNL